MVSVVAAEILVLCGTQIGCNWENGVQILYYFLCDAFW